MTSPSTARGAARLLVVVKDGTEAETVRRAGGVAIRSLDAPDLEEAVGPLRQLDAASVTALDDTLVEHDATLLLDASPDRLLDRVSFPELARFADHANERGVRFGFAGRLEAPDVPRLLPLRPSFLVFDEAIRDDAGRLDHGTLSDVATLFAPPEHAPRSQGEPDKVFVRDLVQEMELGAYASERGRRQRVRFSVEAELAPRTGPWAAADIYSYDRMMDAIRALAQRAPEPFVETLAETLARELLEDARLIAVTIRVEKLDLGPASAGVEIRRGRKN